MRKETICTLEEQKKRKPFVKGRVNLFEHAHTRKYIYVCIEFNIYIHRKKERRNYMCESCMLPDVAH